MLKQKLIQKNGLCEKLTIFLILTGTIVSFQYFYGRSKKLLTFTVSSSFPSHRIFINGKASDFWGLHTHTYHFMISGFLERKFYTSVLERNSSPNFHLKNPCQNQFYRLPIYSPRLVVTQRNLNMEAITSFP